MSEQYKNAVQKIPVPPELIEKTSQAMRNAGGREKTLKKPLYIGVAAAVVIAAVTLYAFWPTGTPDLFVTKPAEGLHMERVELTDGVLLFRQDAETPPPPLLGGPGMVREDWTPAQFRAYLGADIPFGNPPEGMAIAEESAVAYTANGKVYLDLYTALYRDGNGGVLEVAVSKGKLPPGHFAEGGDTSEIGGEPLAVGVDSDIGAYWAQFVSGGAGVVIKGENVSQEKFIRFLHSFFESRATF